MHQILTAVQHQRQGARRLYLRFVRPLLLKHQPAIDDTLNSLHETLVR